MRVRAVELGSGRGIDSTPIIALSHPAARPHPVGAKCFPSPQACEQMWAYSLLPSAPVPPINKLNYLFTRLPHYLCSAIENSPTYLQSSKSLVSAAQLPELPQCAITIFSCPQGNCS